MNEILHANIFFIIASIATVCFCVLVSIALYHLVKILQSIRRIVDRIEAGSASIAEDIDNLRATFLEGGAVSRVLSMFFGGFGTTKKTRPRARSTRSRINNVNQSYGTEKTDEGD